MKHPPSSFRASSNIFRSFLSFYTAVEWISLLCSWSSWAQLFELFESLSIAKWNIYFQGKHAIISQENILRPAVLLHRAAIETSGKNLQRCSFSVAKLSSKILLFFRNILALKSPGNDPSTNFLGRKIHIMIYYWEKTIESTSRTVVYGTLKYIMLLIILIIFR